MIFNLFRKKEKEKIDVPKEGDDTRYIGKYTRDEKGKGVMTHIIGDKYPIRGQPTAVTLKVLEPIKALFDKLITSRLPDLIIHEIPYDNLCLPARAFYDVMEDLIEAEKLEGHKRRWRKARKFLVYFLENDTPYRYKFQWIMERLAKRINEIKLIEADKYFFRVKNFRVDLEDEWKEALKTYPQLKGKMAEFKKFIEVGWDNRKDGWKLGSLTEIATKFLEDNKITK